MISKFKYLIPSLAVLGIVSAASVAVPSVAFAADAMSAAQKPIDRADNRIKELHEALKITPDQEPKFGKLADVMRDNAKQMSDAVEKRTEAEKTSTALDDLKAYQAIAQAHADGLKELVPAFESLYATLSGTQKKEADEMFIHAGGEHGHGHGHKAS